MPFTTAPLNAQEPIIRDPKGRPSKTFIDWVTNLTDDVDASPFRFSPVALANQTASIGTTSIPTGGLSEGLYRVSYYLRITRAAGVSSSVTVTIAWVENGVSLSQSFTAVTGNTTTTIQSGTLLIRSDAASPISYSTAYVSVGAPTMAHSLDVVLEQVAA